MINIVGIDQGLSDIVKIEDEKKQIVKNMEKYYWKKRKLKLAIKQ